MQKNSRLVCMILAIAALALPAMGQSSAKLFWNANSESDIAGYRIHIGTASGAFTVVRDVGKTTSHVLSDLEPSTTYYFAVQAYSTSNLSSSLSAEVPYTTMPDGDYGAWAAAASLSGMQAAAWSTPHNDGVPNVLKYAFNMNPAGPDVRVLQRGTGTAGLPFTSVEQGATGPVFRMEFIRRKGGGLAYEPLISSDLSSYELMTGDTTVVQINVDWERVVIQRPHNPSVAPSLFATVKVSLP